LLEDRGMKVCPVGGLGSLAHLCGEEFVTSVLSSPARVEGFGDECELFDREILSDGPGPLDDTGLIAVAESGVYRTRRN